MWEDSLTEGAGLINLSTFIVLLGVVALFSTFHAQTIGRKLVGLQVSNGIKGVFRPDLIWWDAGSKCLIVDIPLAFAIVLTHSNLLFGFILFFVACLGRSISAALETRIQKGDHLRAIPLSSSFLIESVHPLATALAVLYFLVNI
jgi:hypothetical protein